MVYLTMTSAIVAALDTVERLHLELRDAGNAPASRDSLVNPAVGNPISHDQVITISKILRKQGDISSIISVPSYHLDDLLKGSRIYHESPKPRIEPTSSYKALMARLRQEEEARAYERMINPPPPAETFAGRFPSTNAKLFPPTSQAEIDEDDEITYADINRQMALIINILVSIVACSVAIWMASSRWSTPKRLGLSMGGSVMVGVGEVVVYAGYLRRLKEARKKGRKEVEVKEIMRTWIIGGKESKDDEDKIQEILSPMPEENLRRRRAK